MQGYNVIAVFDKGCERLLMCRRRKDPYKGLLNLVGGKIEVKEDGMVAAYRELYEETSINSSDIVLTHMMDFTYYLDSCRVEVYVGRLNKVLEVMGDENDLLWVDVDTEQNFYSMEKYAGEGNIGHIMEHISMSKDRLLGEVVS